MASQFNASFRGIGEMLTVHPGIVADLARRGNNVAARAEATAPVDVGGPHPGRYKGAFSVESGVRTEPSRRAFSRVKNNAPEALHVEYGTKNNPKHRTLGNALDAAKD